MEVRIEKVSQLTNEDWIFKGYLGFYDDYYEMMYNIHFTCILDENDAPFYFKWQYPSVEGSTSEEDYKEFVIHHIKQNKMRYILRSE